MTEEEIIHCIELCIENKGIPSEGINWVKGLLDLYKKEKEKNKKIKESLTFRVGKSREKENHTMEYEKLNKKNKFGHNGICEDKRHKRKKYRAYITLHGKQYSLGTYNDLETAIKSRKNGEEMIKKMKGAE